MPNYAYFNIIIDLVIDNILNIPRLNQLRKYLIYDAQHYRILCFILHMRLPCPLLFNHKLQVNNDSLLFVPLLAILGSGFVALKRCDVKSVVEVILFYRQLI